MYDSLLNVLLILHALGLPSVYPPENLDLHLKWATMVKLNSDSEGACSTYRIKFKRSHHCRQACKRKVKIKNFTDNRYGLIF